MYTLRYYKARGALEMYAMKEYGLLYSRKEELGKLIREVELVERKEVSFTKDLKKYRDVLEVGMEQWFSMYKNLIGKNRLSRSNFENMVRRKGYIKGEPKCKTSKASSNKR